MASSHPDNRIAWRLDQPRACHERLPWAGMARWTESDP
jgi:hypothetical protein